MDSLFSEGLSLMVYGMGFVFVFLTLLVGVTKVMSHLASKYAPESQPKPGSVRKTPVPAAVAQNDDALVAVITAAVHKYRS